MDLLKWFFWMMAILAIIWYVGGGAERTQRPFIKPPADFGSGTQYGPGERPALTTIISGEKGSVSGDEVTGVNIDADVEEQDPLSIFTGKVTIQGSYGTFSTDPDKEFVTIVASPNNLQPINISNWKLKSAVTGRGVPMSGGTYLIYSGRVNTEDPIFLRPGERAVITTGRSPLGVSFRLNTCTGYFEQFQDFTPALPLQCPRPITEVDPSLYVSLGDDCLDYIERINSCKVQITAIPPALNNSCHDYIATKINYNSCVDTYKNDSDFYKPEWRIFLRRNEELWKKKRETILLLDEEERVVDSISY